MVMRTRVWLLPLALLLALPGCDEKGSASSSQDPDQLARAPKQELPPAMPAGFSSAGPTGTAGRGGEQLRDAVAGMTNPASASKVSAAVFDGNTRDQRDFGGEGAVYAGGATYKTVAYTGAGRKNTVKANYVPEPQTGGLPESGWASVGGSAVAAYREFQQKLYAAVYPVYERFQWKAKAPTRGPVAHAAHRVTIHHTQGRRPMGEDEAMQAAYNTQHYHMVGRGLEGKDNWDDIGYHFLIDGEGRVIEGRRVDTLGAHAGGANTGNIGIAMMGDYNKLQPTAAQKESLERLIVFLALKYRIDPRQNGFLEPHMHFNNTDCPGKSMLSFLPELRAKVQSHVFQDLARLGKGFTPLVASTGVSA